MVILNGIKKILGISDMIITCDIEDKKVTLDKPFKIELNFDKNTYDESFLGANAYICYGPHHNYSLFGEAKISEPFTVYAGDMKKLEFELTVPRDEILIEHKDSLFLLVEVYKHAYSKRKITCSISLEY